jgi:hypothetical protein
MRHISASQHNDLDESSPLFVAPHDLNRERALVRLTYVVRRAKVDVNRQFFDATAQIRLCPALLYNRDVVSFYFIRLYLCLHAHTCSSLFLNGCICSAGDAPKLLFLGGGAYFFSNS